MITSLLPEALCVYLPEATSESFNLTLITIATAAFFGGFAHCAFMCGPFVMMQVSKRLAGVSAGKMGEFTRLKGAALVPYHAGRVVTYGIMGGVAGSLGNFVTEFWRHGAAVFMLLAGCMMIVSVLPWGGVKCAWLATPFFKKGYFLFIKQWFSKLFNNPLGIKGFCLGLVLGFLPCGMVYAGLALAASSADFWRGFAIMLAMGVATIPGLLMVGLFGALAASGVKKRLSFFARGATVLAGIWVCLAALNILGV